MNGTRYRRGFTLTELLIAVALTGVVTSGMIATLSQTSFQATSGNQVNLVQQELAAAQSLISDEAQQGIVLFGSSGVPFTTSVPNSYSSVRRLIGFYQPDASNSGRYFFKMFFLAAPPSTPSGAFVGPLVLYYYQDSNSSTVSQLTTAPASVSTASGTFNAVVDYFRDPSDTTNSQLDTTNCPIPTNLNTAQITAGDTTSGQKYSGGLYLNGVTWNIPGRQSTTCTRRELNLTTVITSRN